MVNVLSINLATILKSLALLLIASQISACSVMSKTDCLDADWRQQGYKVGSSGDPDISEAFNKREKRCARFNANADWKAFESGYAQGIDEYCDVSNAVTLGARGASRAIEACPESEYFGFYKAFNAGYKLFQLNEQVREADYQLGRLESNLYSYQRERNNLRHRLNSNELSEDERNYAAERFRRLRRQISHLQWQSRELESRLYSTRRAADKYYRHLKSEYKNSHEFDEDDY